MELNISKTKKVVDSVRRALGNLEALTKRLKVMSVSAQSPRRKIVISSKDLIVSDLTVGTKIVIEVRKGVGLWIRKALPGDTNLKTVSYRCYANREGLEPVIDLRHQMVIDNAIGDAEHVRIVFKRDGILIEPSFSHEERVLSNPKAVTIDISEKDDDGLYSCVVEAIRVIKASRFSSITIDVSDELFQSHEFTLFSIQLRRLGYKLGLNQSGNFLAQIPCDGVTPVQVENIKFNHPANTNTERCSLINSNFDFNEPLSTFTSCTGGVDISALESEGFTNLMALDYRPHESRDFKKTVDESGETIIQLNDKSDVGALSAMLNGKNVKVVFNENLYGFDLDTVSSLLKPFNFLHISLCCSDFSSLKNKKDRLNAIESLDTTIDMFFEALDLIEKSKVPTFLIENVKNFNNSIEAKLFEKGLNSFGYTCYKKVLKAPDYNGMTSRERCYLFASALNNTNFEFPQKIEKTTHAWFDVILPNIDQLRDVSHTKSVKKGLETGRISLLKEGGDTAPTIFRSQSRQTKDALYLQIDGKYYLPSNEILMKLMGFVEGFDLSAFTNEIGSELINQLKFRCTAHFVIVLKIIF
jgi:site-specific DNA-cytosine methylase